MNKALITVFYNKNNNAGPKAQMDVISFLKPLGYKNITLPFNVRSKVGKFKYAFYDLPHLFKSNQFDIIIFQYPIFSDYIVDNLIKSVRKYTNAKLYFITHDIDSLRAEQYDENLKNSEINRLNQTDGLIVHNVHMKKWLTDNGIKVPMVNLEIFDYDNHWKLNDDDKYQQTICFAGNLEKAPFLDKLNFEKIHLDIYGSNPARHYGNGVEYHGQYTPDELLKHLTQNFGLVWDGTSIKTCNGRYGNYLRYNDPHKASLYLSCGMPIIVWNQSALADYVNENNIGITVSSLLELEDKLTEISLDDFKVMKNNVLNLAVKLRNGENIKKAVKQLQNLN